MSGDTPLLTRRGLHKSFGPTPAPPGMDLSVDAGEVLAVTGPSGSGKSTLLHCLAGILTPDAGEVTFDGRRVDHMPDRERSRLRRAEFGFVFQFGQLVPELPVLSRPCPGSWSADDRSRCCARPGYASASCGASCCWRPGCHW